MIDEQKLNRLKRRIEISNLKRQDTAEIVELSELIKADGSLWECMETCVLFIDKLLARNKVYDLQLKMSLEHKLSWIPKGLNIDDDVNEVLKEQADELEALKKEEVNEAVYIGF